MSHSVYILKCSDGTLYTGYTTNIDRRILEHNHSHRGAKYTRGRRPVTLVWSEKYSTRGQALSRERELKGYTREQKLSLFHNS